MSPAVFGKHRVAEILDAQAQPRDAQFFQRVDLRLGKRSRLALERDFFGLVPIDVGPQAIDQRRELLAAEERGSAAAEIDEAKRPAPHHRQPADQLDFARQGRDILLDLVRVLVGVNAEIAELAPLAAKRECADKAPAARRPAATPSPARTSGKPSAVHCENGG